MKHVMGSIYDNKGEFFMTPHFFKSSADFIRNIQVEAKNLQSMLNKFPADYELHIIGSYDEMTGSIEQGDLVKRLGSVLDLCPLS